MQIEVNEVKKPEKPKYPYLGIAEDGVTVLFIKPSTGIRMHFSREFSGELEHGWAEHHFKKFIGTITLSN